MKFFIVFVTGIILADPSPKVDLRKSFHECILDESKIPEFYAHTVQIPNPNALERSYLAVANAMMAKLSWNPLEKINYIEKYTRLIDTAVKEESKSIEIRFLRLSIDHHIPWFFDRKSNLTIDKEVILNQFSNEDFIVDLDPGFNKYILYFLKSERICTPNEIRIIESKLILN